MSIPATYDDAHLLLRLFELRRDPELRKARDWYGNSFTATNAEAYPAFQKIVTMMNVPAAAARA